MARPSSLSRRLFLLTTVGATTLWLLAAAGTSLLLRQQLDAAFDGGLRETAERLLPLAAHTLRDTDGDGDELEIAEMEEGGIETVVYQVRDAAGRILMRSADAPRDPFDLPLVTGFADAGAFRVFTLRSDDASLLVQVGEAHSRREGLLLDSLLVLLLPVVALVPLIAIGLVLSIRSGLAPVRRLSIEIGGRAPGDLKPFDAGDVPVELKPMVDAVQALVERLDTALRAEREFAANAAHELRTPVAGALAQTQRLIAELKGQEQEGRAQQVEQTLQRVRHLTERLLQLSRADAGIAPSEPRDLLPALRLLAADARLDLAVAPEATLEGPIDIDAFGIVMRNLLENAVLHGVPGRPISIMVPARNTIEIENGLSGPALSPEQLVRRFQRGQTKATGSGLGLSIVDTIMRQTGGRVEFSGTQDGVFRVRLTFGGQVDAES